MQELRFPPSVADAYGELELCTRRYFATARRFCLLQHCAKIARRLIVANAKKLSYGN